MKFILEFDINTEGAEEGEPAGEIVAILARTAVRVADSFDLVSDGDAYPVRDTNGNTIGTLRVSEA